MKLWDLMWSQFRTRHFGIFVAAAIMKVTAPAVLEKQQPDQILEFYSNVSGTLDLTDVILVARQVCCLLAF